MEETKLGIKFLGESKINGKCIKTIEGGFGEGQKVILVSDVAELHGVEVRVINQMIERNKDKYTGNDIIDLCEENFKITASDLGLIKSNRQKHCYILSQRGYIKLVSSMSNDNQKKWEIMNQIIEEYFTMREVLQQISPEDVLLLNIAKAPSIEQQMVAVGDYGRFKLEQGREEQRAKDAHKVKIVDERYDKGNKITITDVTKTYNLKTGQLMYWARENGYIRKDGKDVNKKGDKYFKTYETEFKDKNGVVRTVKNIGVTAEGSKLIEDNLEEIKNSKCRRTKDKIIGIAKKNK